MAKKILATKQAPELTDEEPKSTGKVGKRSFADAFDSTPKGGGGGWPNGKYNVNIVEMELIENEKGIAAKVVYQGHEDEDELVAGKKLTPQYYTLQKADGSTGGGVGFLKADLEKLGYDEFKFVELEDIFREISRNEPEVEITVKQNGQFTNAYLNGLVE